MAASAAVVQLVGADELAGGPAEEAWQAFADLMSEVEADAPGADGAAHAGLAARLDAAITALRRAGARVVAGGGGAVLFVAVVPTGYRRDLRALFATA